MFKFYTFIYYTPNNTSAITFALLELIIFPPIFVSSLPHHGWQNVINPSQTQHFFILSTWINRFSLIGAIITFINLNLFYMKNIFLVMFDTTKNASKCKVNLINWKTFFGMSHTQQTTKKKKNPFSMVLLFLNPLSLSTCQVLTGVDQP